MLGNVDYRIRIEQKFGSERADVDSGLAEVDGKSQIVCGVAFLEIRLREGVADQRAGFP